MRVKIDNFKMTHTFFDPNYTQESLDQSKEKEDRIKIIKRRLNKLYEERDMILSNDNNIFDTIKETFLFMSKPIDTKRLKEVLSCIELLKKDLREELENDY